MEQAVSSDPKQKTSKSRRETAVQGTNDNSIVSKCSMSAAGYFDDAFLKMFVAKTSKRAPLINRGYFVRAVCIDQVLRQFVLRDPGVKKQIVSLGAGFDSAYFRLKAAGLLKDSSFYEIDYPEVTKRKNAIIHNNPELRNLLTVDADTESNKVVPPIELSTVDYNLLGCDLTQLNTLEAALRMCGADFDSPTLLLSECVMTYMTRRCSSALVKWAGETFQDALFVMFEQINPDDAFGTFMQNHFHTIGSPLKCIGSFPTVESQMKRFLNLGWESCKCHDLNELYRHRLSPEERARIETLDPFDEYEEFNLKCAHYFLLVASNGPDIDEFLVSSAVKSQEKSSRSPPPKEGLITLTSFPPPKQLNIKRFSHTSVLMADRFIVTTGGFGEVDGRHQRVQEVSVTDSVTMETKLVRCHSEIIQYSRMHHSAVVLSDGRLLLFGGRQSPFFLCSQTLLIHLEVNVANGIADSNATQENSSVMEKSDDCLEIMRNVNDVRNPKNTNCGFTNPENRSTNSENVNTNSENLNDTNSGNENRGGLNVTNIADCVGSSGDESRHCDDKSRNGEQKTNGAKNHKVESGTKCGNEDEDNIPASLENASSVCDAESADSVVSDGLIEGEETTTFDWGQLTCSAYKQSGDIPCARWRHAVALVTIKGEEKMFLHGGRTQKAEVLNDAFLLDIKSGEWTKLDCKGERPGPLHSHTMLTWNDGESQRVVAVGGVDSDQCPQSAVYLLDVDTLTWKALSVSGAFLPRYSHTAHVVGDKLVVVGGVNLQRNTPGVAIVNLRTGQAEEFAFPAILKNQLLMFHRHCSVLLPEGKLVILGGGGNCFSFGTHLNNTPVVMDVSQCLQAAV